MKYPTYIVMLASLLALGCTEQARDPMHATFQVKPTTDIELISANSAADYDQIGQHYEQLNNTEMALTAYHKALRLEPLHINSLQHLSSLLMRNNRTDEAIAVLGQLVKAEPTAKNYNNLGFAYLQKHDYAQAQTALQRSIALDSEYIKAKNNLALLEMSVTAAKNEPPVVAQATISKPSQQASLQQKDKYLYGLQYQPSSPVADHDDVVVVDAQPEKKPVTSPLGVILKFLSLVLLL